MPAFLFWSVMTFKESMTLVAIFWVLFFGFKFETAEIKIHINGLLKRYSS